MANSVVFTGPEGGVSDPLEINGITSKAGSDLTIEPVAGHITKIGSAFVTSHAIATKNDLGVNGVLEVNGIVYADAGLTVAGAALTVSGGAIFSSSWTQFNYAARFNDDISCVFGSGSDAIIRYGTAQTPDTLFVGVSTDSNHLVIAQVGDVATDFANAQETNPTLIIQSADQTTPAKRVRFTHNQVDAEITTPTGGVIMTGPASAPTLTGNSQFAVYFDQAGHNLKFTCKYSDGTAKTATIAFD